MNTENTRILKGDICYSTDKDTLITVENGYLVCENGISAGVFQKLPEAYMCLPVEDFTGHLIIPGLTDLHMHAPQYAFRGFKMDLELLDWLNSSAFPEEARYEDEEYARAAYSIFVNDLRKSGTTRGCFFATLHLPATEILMELLEESGLETMVGKVNMDRNCPDYLREKDAETSAALTLSWLERTAGKFRHTKPILTPRFIPACSDELMRRLADIQKSYGLPVQSHLSENPGEIAWVQELVPQSRFYGDAYDLFGLFGGDVPTIMAHCVHCPPEEMDLMEQRGIYIAHCPQSNANLTSGAAPVRAFLDRNMKVGLGSDIAGGTVLSIFRAMAESIQVSKLRARLTGDGLKPLSMQEAFFLGTKGGGSFFGNAGSFEAGYQCDALVLDESRIPHPQKLTLAERLERYIYLSGDDWILHKYVQGRKLF